MLQIIVFYCSENTAKLILFFELKLSYFIFQREASAAVLLNEQGELATLKISKAATVIKIKKNLILYFIFM